MPWPVHAIGSTTSARAAAGAPHAAALMPARGWASASTRGERARGARPAAGVLVHLGGERRASRSRPCVRRRRGAGTPRGRRPSQASARAGRRRPVAGGRRRRGRARRPAPASPWMQGPHCPADSAASQEARFAVSATGHSLAPRATTTPAPLAAPAARSDASSSARPCAAAVDPGPEVAAHEQRPGRARSGRRRCRSAPAAGARRAPRRRQARPPPRRPRRAWCPAGRRVPTSRNQAAP